ncbi:MAG: GNAT family N-acetyltransferase [Oscillospiraceae bacterium]|nr:GNAT family N-acetyltransferase [Oscillospiraceae bacterium]
MQGNIFLEKAVAFHKRVEKMHPYFVGKGCDKAFMDCLLESANWIEQNLRLANGAHDRYEFLKKQTAALNRARESESLIEQLRSSGWLTGKMFDSIRLDIGHINALLIKAVRTTERNNRGLEQLAGEGYRVGKGSNDSMIHCPPPPKPAPPLQAPAPPLCESPRLLLRPLQASDAGELYGNLLSDAEVLQYTHIEPAASVTEAAERIGLWAAAAEEEPESQWHYYGIVLKDTEELIGIVNYCVTDSAAKSAEAGYYLGKGWWGRGYATEVLRRLIAYLIADAGLQRVWACHNVRNPRSGEVMKRAGMQYEGTLRRWRYRKGEYITSHLYAILADDLGNCT